MTDANPDPARLDRTAPLAKLLAHHGGPVLPDPMPISEIPENAWRAYVVLTSAAIRQEIAALEANPPDNVADRIREDPTYADTWRHELNGMRGIEMAVSDWAGQVMAQLYPYAHQHPAPRQSGQPHDGDDG